MQDEIVKTEGGTIFAGPRAVSVYQAIAVRRGLLTYAQTGMKLNRMWTPKAMLLTASSITGKAYKRGAYVKAAEDLQTWIDATRGAIPVRSE